MNRRHRWTALAVGLVTAAAWAQNTGNTVTGNPGGGEGQRTETLEKPAARKNAPVLSESTGRVIFQAGGNAARALTRGRPILADGLLRTEDDSSAVIGFADGQIVSVGPNASFKINAYTYDPADPAKNENSLNLIEGSARVVTGALGLSNPGLIRIQVGTSTLAGVVGGDYTMASEGGVMLVAVNKGEALLRLPSGEALPLPAGQAVYMDAEGRVNRGSIAQMDALARQSAAGRDLVARSAELDSLAFAQRNKESAAFLAAQEAVAQRGSSGSGAGAAGAAQAGADGSATAGSSGSNTAGTQGADASGNGPVAAAGLPESEVGVNELPPPGDVGPTLNLPPLVTAAAGVGSTGASSGGSPCTASCN